jgi:hypothetical protein
LVPHYFSIGSQDKTLKVVTKEEGGYHHFQIDNASIAVTYMWDWLEGNLKGFTVDGRA